MDYTVCRICETADWNAMKVHLLILTVTTLIAETIATCPIGWGSGTSKCYLETPNTMKSFDESVVYCANQRSTLPTIRSTDEYSALVQGAGNPSMFLPWLLIRYSPVNTQQAIYSYDNGQPQTFLPWSLNQPFASGTYCCITAAMSNRAQISASTCNSGTMDVVCEQAHTDAATVPCALVKQYNPSGNKNPLLISMVPPDMADRSFAIYTDFPFATAYASTLNVDGQMNIVYEFICGGKSIMATDEEMSELPSCAMRQIVAFTPLCSLSSSFVQGILYWTSGSPPAASGIATDPTTQDSYLSAGWVAKSSVCFFAGQSSPGICSMTGGPTTAAATTTTETTTAATTTVKATTTVQTTTIAPTTTEISTSEPITSTTAATPSDQPTTIEPTTAEISTAEPTTSTTATTISDQTTTAETTMSQPTTSGLGNATLMTATDTTTVAEPTAADTSMAQVSTDLATELSSIASITTETTTTTALQSTEITSETQTTMTSIGESPSTSFVTETQATAELTTIQTSIITSMSSSDPTTPGATVTPDSTTMIESITSTTPTTSFISTASSDTTSKAVESSSEPITITTSTTNFISTAISDTTSEAVESSTQSKTTTTASAITTTTTTTTLSTSSQLPTESPTVTSLRRSEASTSSQTLSTVSETSTYTLPITTIAEPTVILQTETTKVDSTPLTVPTVPTEAIGITGPLGITQVTAVIVATRAPTVTWAPGATAATGASIVTWAPGATAATGAPIVTWAPGATAATGASIVTWAPGATAATGAPIVTWAPGATTATGAPGTSQNEATAPVDSTLAVAPMTASSNGVSSSSTIAVTSSLPDASVDTNIPTTTVEAVSSPVAPQQTMTTNGLSTTVSLATTTSGVLSTLNVVDLSTPQNSTASTSLSVSTAAIGSDVTSSLSAVAKTSTDKVVQSSSSTTLTPSIIDRTTPASLVATAEIVVTTITSAGPSSSLSTIIKPSSLSEKPPSGTTTSVINSDNSTASVTTSSTKEFPDSPTESVVPLTQSQIVTSSTSVRLINSTSADAAFVSIPMGSSPKNNVSSLEEPSLTTSDVYRTVNELSASNTLTVAITADTISSSISGSVKEAISTNSIGVTRLSDSDAHQTQAKTIDADNSETTPSINPEDSKTKTTVSTSVKTNQNGSDGTVVAVGATENPSAVSRDGSGTLTNTGITSTSTTLGTGALTPTMTNNIINSSVRSTSSLVSVLDSTTPTGKPNAQSNSDSSTSEVFPQQTVTSMVYSSLSSTNTVKYSAKVAADFEAVPVNNPREVIFANLSSEEILTAIDMPQSNDSIVQSTVVKRSLTYTMAAMTPEEMETISSQFDDVFIGCSYSESNCLSSNEFQTDISTDYGTCFKFNYRNARRLRSGSGRTNGLSLTLSVNNGDYVCTSESAGLKFVLHDQNEAAFPDASGFYVRGGVKTTVIISRKEIRKQKACVDSSPLNSTYYYEGIYTTEGCLRSRYQSRVITQCLCADPRFAKPDNASFCTIFETDCLENLSDVIVNVPEEDKTFCKSPCLEVIYETSITTAPLTKSNSNLNKQCRDLINGSSDDHAMDDCLTCLTDDIAVVEIFYGTLEQITYKEMYSYGLNMLWSDISAITGLQSGADVTLTFEIIILIWRVLCRGRR